MSEVAFPLWAVWTVLTVFFAFTGWLSWTLQKERASASESISSLSVLVLRQSEKIRELAKELEAARKNGKA